MRTAVFVVAVLTVAGCKKKETDDEPASGDRAARTLESKALLPETSGTISAIDYADAYEADGANRAALKEKYADKRWVVKVCENLTINEDHLKISTHSNTRWVSVKIRFRDPKEIASIDWLGSLKRVSVNARCVDAFTFEDAVLIKMTPEELKSLDKDKRIAEVRQKIDLKNIALNKFKENFRYTNSIRYQNDSDKQKILEELRNQIANSENEIRSLEQEMRKIGAE